MNDWYALLLFTLLVGFLAIGGTYMIYRGERAIPNLIPLEAE